MDNWSGEVLDPESRRRALQEFDEDAIDSEFLSYLERINSLPYVVSGQCCVGHMPIPAQFRVEGNWGYLLLYSVYSVAEYLAECASDWAWLWPELSQLWVPNAELPGCTDEGVWQIACAWMASAWPQPAMDICDALERFGRSRSTS